MDLAKKKKAFNESWERGNLHGNGLFLSLSLSLKSMKYALGKKIEQRFLRVLVPGTGIHSFIAFKFIYLLSWAQQCKQNRV